MKGIVFTEFLDMVRTQHSEDLLDDVLDAANTPNDGAYTSVGTYDHQELVSLVVAYTKQSGRSVREALLAFGEHLFTRFHANYPHFFTGIPSAFLFLSRIEDVIHAEVLKLYPDAELPRFDVERHTDDELVLRYHSARHFEDLAEGLIRGCIRHFEEQLTVTRETIREGDQVSEQFRLVRDVSVS